MDFFVEFVLEVLLEGSIGIIQNKKVNKWIRYFVSGVLVTFYLSIIGFIVIVGCSFLKKGEYLIGIIFEIIDLFLMILFYKFFQKIFFKD